MSPVAVCCFAVDFGFVPVNERRADDERCVPFSANRSDILSPMAYSTSSVLHVGHVTSASPLSFSLMDSDGLRSPRPLPWPDTGHDARKPPVTGLTFRSLSRILVVGAELCTLALFMYSRPG